MQFIDLKSKTLQSHTCAAPRKEMANEFRKDGVLSTDGLSALIRISPLCGSLSRQLQSEKLFMLGPVSIDGLCSAHLSRKSQRHRDLFESCGRKALPHGHSRQGLAQHPRSHQRGARLENLPRLCQSTDSKRQGTLFGRSSPSSTRSNGLCLRFYHRRSVSDAIPLGEVSKAQGRREASYPFGLTCQHPHRSDCHYGSCPRREHHGRAVLGTRIDLRDGPRLRGLRSALPHPARFGLLCHQSEEELALPTPLLQIGR